MRLNLATSIHGTGAEVIHLGASGDVVSGDLDVADLEREIADVTVDSRTVGDGSLFVCLPGERVDGHAFAADAFERGARACLVSAQVDRRALVAALADHDTRYLLTVPDPLLALQSLAGYWRSLHRLEVVAVTGSIGKTTTKDIVASLLASKLRVLQSEGNFNNEIGLPLTLLRCRSDHRIAVLEMGTYGKGEISRLCEIADPSIGIVTNVEPVHLERMGSVEEIARAKSELVAALPSDGVAVLNADDPWTRAMARSSGICRPVLVGWAHDSDIRALEVRAEGLEAVSLTFAAEGRTVSVRARVAGAHNLIALLVACAAARELDMSWEEIEEGMLNVHSDSRQNVIRLPNLVIIDDSYNAAPKSMNAALELLRSGSGNRMAILGDMLELGTEEESAHRQVGVWAAGVVDWLVVRGPRAEWIAEGARGAGLPAERIVRTMTNREAADAALSITHSKVPALVSGGPSEAPPSWTVLVKGSRGMVMEEVVERIRQAA
jgi:UDP-N-acetylmuramoyl-tripeptide--D-alanyl-D-alanine ligase